MNIFKSFILVCVPFFLVQTLSAQKKKLLDAKSFGTINGSVEMVSSNGSILDVDNANITIIIERDTLHATTFSGVFFLKKVPVGKAKIFVSMVGYSTITQSITIKPGKNENLTFFLKERSQLLNEVVVKGKASPASIHGDTIIYNPKAISIQEGDVVMDIVQQMPGVKVENGTVSVNGKEIKKTYVDGRLIFGHDPLTALNNLSASDVVKIQAFDEFDNKESRKKILQGEKIRVFNISTKSHLVSSFDTRLLGSAGSNIGHNDKGAFRKGAGITSNFFSEKFLFSLNAFHNNMARNSNNIKEILNITDPGNTYQESTYVDANIERNWDKKNGTNGSLKLNYNFGLNKSDADSRTEQNYFTSADYNSRVYATADHQHNLNRWHNVAFFLDSGNDKWGRFSWEQNFRFERSDSRSLNRTSNTVDGHIISQSNLRNDGSSKPLNILESLSYTKSIGKKLLFSIHGTFNNNNGNEKSLRLDTLQSSSSYTYLTMPAHTRQTKAGGSLDIMWYPQGFEQYAITFITGAEYNDGYRNQFAWNMTDATHPVADENNTYSYNNHSMMYYQTLSTNIAFSKDLQHLLGIIVQMSETTIRRNEVKWDNYRKTFVSPLVSLTYRNNKIANNYEISYRLSSRLPNIEQLRPQIDNKDPYMLSCGNPHLRQTISHDLAIQGSHFMEGGKNVIEGYFGLSILQNNIVNKATYFSKSTYLTDQRYMAQAGSTLNSYANVQGTWNARANVKWEHALRSIKSNYAIGISYQHSNNPYFVGDNRVTVRNDAPAFIQQLKGTPMRNLKWRLTTKTQCNFYSGDNTNKNFVQTADGSFTLNNIFKVLYLNTTYQFTFNRTYGTTSSTNSMNILNLNLGCKILKRQGDITFSAYDVLGSHNNFATKVISNYVRNQWTNYYGRYFAINFAYHFGKVKSNYKGSLNEGDATIYRNF